MPGQRKRRTPTGTFFSNRMRNAVALGERHNSADRIFRNLKLLRDFRNTHAIVEVSGYESDMPSCAQFLARAISTLLQTNDQHLAGQAAHNFAIFHRQASAEDQSKMEAIRNQANLGTLPPPPTS